MEALATLRRSSGAGLCAECGKCTSVCPLAACGGFSARAIACQHLEEEIEGHGLGVQRCLTCGTCEIRCPQGVRFMDLVRGIRELTAPDGVPPDCPHGGALLSLMKIMARGELEQDRLGWLDGDLEAEPETGEVFFWTGCAVYYDAFFSDLPASTLDATRAGLRLLNRLGSKPVVSAAERCCGHDLLWNGDRDGFERLARHNVDLVARSGAKTLVTPCAECLRTWRIDYAPFFKGAPPRALHLSEFLAERLSELKLADLGPRRITFQDPCRLGRHLGVYDAPRRVLAALPGAVLAEMRRTGPAALCCAGGWGHCDGFSKRIQVERLREAKATGAEVLVTACPKCRIHFRCAMRDPDIEAELRVETRDVGELLAEALA
jgi:heterodisulfide reductase subunit D